MVFGSVDDDNRRVRDTAVGVINVVLAAFGTAEIGIAPRTASGHTTVKLVSGCADGYSRHVPDMVARIIGA